MVLHHGLQFFQRRAVLKILWAFGSPASFIALGRACRYGATSAARAAAGGYCRVLVVIIRRLQLAQKFSEGMRYVVEFL